MTAADSPLREPPLFVSGFPALVRWFASVGIRLSVKAARHLPLLMGDPESFAHGKYRAFSRCELKDLVSHVTDFPFEEWMQRWEASARDRYLLSWPLRWPTTAPRPGVLYTLTDLARDDTEWIHRDSAGYTCAALSREEARRWPFLVRFDAYRALRWTRARLFREQDWKIERVRHKPIAALVVPMILHGGRLRLMTVPGSAFGLSAIRTCAIEAAGWTGWPDLYDWIRKGELNVVWTTWTVARDVDRRTLEVK